MPEAVPRLPGRVSGLRGLQGLAEPGGPGCSGSGRDGAGPDRNPKPRRALFPTLVPPRAVLCFLLCFSETRSPRTRWVARDGFELALFLPPLRECGDDRGIAMPGGGDAGSGTQPCRLISALTSQPSEAGV